jgi:hypothetical protein
MATNITYEAPVLPVSSNTNIEREARNHALGLGLIDTAAAAAESTRGTLQYVYGDAGAADQLLFTAKTSADTYANRDLLSNAVGGLATVVDTAGAFATPIVLTEADSGKIYLLDDAAGLDFTLPAIGAANIGMRFDFKLQTEVTSNSYRWTAQAADLLLGRIIIFDKDVAEGSTEALLQVMRPDGSDDLICTIAGADDTQGSLVGGSVSFLALTATRWWVEGILIGDGALATNFS